MKEPDPQLRWLPMRKPTTLPLLATLLCLTWPNSQAAENPRQLAAADYQTLSLHDWTIHVENALDNHPRRKEALDLLESKLLEIKKLLPKAATEKLVDVPIWLSKNTGSGACYHLSADWLKNNGRIVEMERSIELQNINHFIDWADTQPHMILHELAHAWHHQHLDNGYQNEHILAAYQSIVESGIYNNVPHASGEIRRHYGLNNAMEYFAESSEAYFGQNDFHPFNRQELKSVDPTGYQMVKLMWNITESTPPTTIDSQ